MLLLQECLAPDAATPTTVCERVPLAHFIALLDGKNFDLGQVFVGER